MPSRGEAGRGRGSAGIYQHDRIALELLQEFYSFLPTRRATGSARSVLSAAEGMFLLAAMTEATGYLYVVSGEGVNSRSAGRRPLGQGPAGILRLQQQGAVQGGELRQGGYQVYDPWTAIRISALPAMWRPANCTSWAAGGVVPLVRRPARVLQLPLRQLGLTSWKVRWT